MLYGTPKKIPDGRYYLKCTGDDEKTRVMVQLNNVTLFTEDDNTVVVEMNNTDKIDSIDTQNLEAAKTNSEAWFGKTLNEKTLETAYTSSVTNGRMNVTKATVAGKVVTKVYNYDRTIMDNDELPTDTKCDVILEFAGLWFMKKTYGPIWRLAQVKLKSPPKKMYPDECLFDDQEDEEIPGEQDEDYI